MNKFIRLNKVKEKTGLSRSSIYQFIKEGKFPAQVKLGQRAAAWVDSEVDDWINGRISNRQTIFE
jgi:prophage regulatory protein